MGLDHVSRRSIRRARSLELGLIAGAVALATAVSCGSEGGTDGRHPPGAGDGGEAGASGSGGANGARAGASTSGRSGSSGATAGGSAGAAGDRGDGGSGQGGGGGTGAMPCYTAVAAGETHACALRRDGTLWCWGGNEHGQLGIGTIGGLPHPEPVQAEVLKTTGIARFAGGANHGCAVDSHGSVWCWGANDLGQASGSTSQHRPSPRKAFSEVSHVVSGRNHSCATHDDDVVCWGSSGSGQAGILLAASPYAVVVAGLSGPPSHLVAGDFTTCAVLADGHAECWGTSVEGGAPTAEAVAAAQFDEDVAEMALGTQHSCSRKTDGTVWCIGANQLGQLGVGEATASAPTAQEVSSIDSVAKLFIGGSTTCATKTDGTLWCWGMNDKSQAGPDSGERCVGAQVPCIFEPTQVPEARDVVTVSIGVSHTCYLDARGSVWCFGANAQGQLGDGSYAASPLPVEVALPCAARCGPKRDACLPRSRSECESLDGCAYVLAECVDAPGDDCDAPNSMQCLFNPDCSWSESVCSGEPQSCSTFSSNQTACLSRTGCQWSAGTQSFCYGAARPCGDFSVAGDRGCYGVPDGCVDLEQSECEDRSECTWE